jgi:hypothetical protein
MKVSSVPQMLTKVQSIATLLVTSLVATIGCKHFGPRSIVADRVPYNEAIASSWKEQTLLNIVKLRYVEAPFFIDVPQITSGYTLQQQAMINGGIFPPVNPIATFGQQLGLDLNLQGIYQDRPTISYTPQTGSQFIRNLTNPINPGSVLFLVQSGYPADVVFDLTVDSINGIRNRTVIGGQVRNPNPQFSRIVLTLRKAQLSGHIGIRVQHEKDKPDSVVLFFHDKDVDPELAAELAEMRRLLRLDPEKQDFRVVFGATSASPNEIAILTRSAYSILLELATYVEAPVEHQLSGIAPPIGDHLSSDRQPFRVLSGCKKPCNAFVAVFYEGHWFWIEKNDFSSKRTMNYLLILLALADTAVKENPPIITIQAN